MSFFGPAEPFDPINGLRDSLHYLDTDIKRREEEIKRDQQHIDQNQSDIAVLKSNRERVEAAIRVLEEAQ